MTEDQLRRKRELDAEAAGEGQWLSNATGKWLAVDVTFYPKLQRWITENGERGTPSNLASGTPERLSPTRNIALIYDPRRHPI